jgi:glutamyl/glutaminyl-tRNA synthetase
VDRPSPFSTQPVFRFAPSPNGRLHLGHAYSALLNEQLARRTGGRLLLRIEDIDLARCRPEFDAAIFEDLAWLGFDWERRSAANPSISTITARPSRNSAAGRGLSVLLQSAGRRARGG